jgi:hypothetical protein
MSACDELEGCRSTGDQVPRDGAGEPAEDHPLVHHARIHDALAHGLGHLDAEAEGAATKLKKAAHATACMGVSTRVETTVAMELAASWKPLM